MRRWIIIISCSLWSLVSFAQEKIWTLTECMQYAVKHSLKRTEQKAQNEIYKQDYKEAVGGLLPTVTADAGTEFTFGRGINSQTNTYTNVNTFYNSFDVYSSVVLFDGFARLSKVKLQKINRLKGKQELQQAEDLLAYETMELFFNVVYYQGTVKLAKQQLEESTANLRQQKRMEELGLKAAPDVAEMQAKEAEDEFNVTKQTNLANLEVIKLKEKMNFPIDEKLVVDDSITEDLVDASSEDALTIFRRAVLYSPKVLASQKGLQASEMAYRVVKGNQLPTLTLNGGASTVFSRLMNGGAFMSYRDQMHNNLGYYVALTLTVPVFDGFSHSAAVQRGKQNVIIAKSEQEETLRTVYGEIEQAVADMNGQAEEYLQAKKKSAAMEIAHQLNQRKYEEGLISALELNTSANRLLQSRLEEMNAQLKYQLKHRLVEYYKGSSFEK